MGRAILLCLCVMHFVSYAEQHIPYTEHFIEQQVDHFNSYWTKYGKETFLQRYLIQGQWWNPGKGPIFFYTGNEGNIEDFWENTGFVFEIAPKFQALVVFAEHRFYGKSLPFGEATSFKQPYISLLSMPQALADFAVVIKNLKTELNCTSVPVIAFGGSYGGMLSAYIRLTYPSLVTGSVAASAPVLLVSGDVARNFFFEDVSQDFKNSGCDGQVKSAFQQVADYAAKGAEGYRVLAEIFNVCKLGSTQHDLQHLYTWIRNAFTVLAMMDYPYPTNFLAKLPAWPVEAACQKMLGNDSDIHAIAHVVDMIYPLQPGQCHDIWTEYIDCADPTGCAVGSDSQAWDYQACTDFLMPGGSNNITDIFPSLPFTLSDRASYCWHTWQVNPDMQMLQLSYSEKDFAASSNIVFSNGRLDPWHRGGILSDLSETVVSVMIDEGAHHLDLRSSNRADPQSVVKARQFEVQHIESWITKKSN